MAVERVALDSAALAAALHERFGFAAFLPGQEEIVGRVLAGDDLLVVRPTGSGKSLCYQLPALLLPPLTVVVSPLIALMKDQVDGLTARDPASATFINSSLGADEQRSRLFAALDGRYKLLYVAPERFRLNGFMQRLRQATVHRFVVDEAHCISEWGHDFRPDYRRLGEVLAALGDPPLLALTATATVEVQRDILQQLGRPEGGSVVSGFNRPNLSFEVKPCVDEAMKWRHLEELLAELDGGGIVYAATRAQTDAVAEFIAKRTDRPVVAYHAGYDSGHRSEAQELFMSAPAAIAVATSAFGMGVDRPDVRFVIHYSLPGTLEAYYQQAGRAGRDGLPARCILLYDPADRGLQEWFIENDRCPPDLPDRMLRELTGEPCGEEQLPTRLDCNESQARQALELLLRCGAVTESGAGYIARRQRLGRDEASEFGRAARRREELRRRQLDTLCRYAEATRGRRRRLLRYFGDNSPLPDDVDALDSPPPPRPDPRVVTPEETEVARVILETVLEIGGRLGRSKIVQVMRGSKSASVPNWARRLATHGRLATFRGEHLREAIDELAYQCLLTSTGGDYPTLEITPAGRAVLDDPHALIAVPSLRTSAPVLAAERVEKQSDLPDGEDEPAFELLRAWRLETARARGIAPFMVFHDKTLRTIAKLRPDDISTLLGIPGVGPHKAEQYGPSLIAALTGAAPPAPVRADAPTTASFTVDEPSRKLAERLREVPDLAAVAVEFGLSETALQNQITALIAAGELRPEELLGDEQTRLITAVLATDPAMTLSAARRALGDEVGFAPIRWVREALRRAPAASSLPADTPPEEAMARVGSRLAAAAVVVPVDESPLSLRVAELASRRHGVLISFGLTDGADEEAIAKLHGPVWLVGAPDRVAAIASALAAAGVQPVHRLVIG